MNKKLMKAELPKSTDTTTINDCWSLLGLAPLGWVRFGEGRSGFLNLRNAMELTVLSTLPLESGSFFFQQLLSLYKAIPQKQSFRQELRPSALFFIARLYLLVVISRPVGISKDQQVVFILCRTLFPDTTLLEVRLSVAIRIARINQGKSLWALANRPLSLEPAHTVIATSPAARKSVNERADIRRPIHCNKPLVIVAEVLGMIILRENSIEIKSCPVVVVGWQGNWKRTKNLLRPISPHSRNQSSVAKQHLEAS